MVGELPTRLIELTVGAQALELRGHRPGRGTERALEAVRGHVPFLSMGQYVPDVTALADAVRSGEISRAVLGSTVATGTRPGEIGDAHGA